MDVASQIDVEIEKGKILHIVTLAKGDLNDNGQREVFYEMNGQLRYAWPMTMHWVPLPGKVSLSPHRDQTWIMTILFFFSKFPDLCSFSTTKLQRWISGLGR
jgi:hypothetical protein